MTHSRPAVTAMLRNGGLQPRRDLGQNFVADPNTVRKIAHLAQVGTGDRVVEIGAGLGSLTLALAETGAEVLAIEVDRGIVPVLRDVTAALPNVTVIEADATQPEWRAELGDHTWTLVANLPYNVATPLVCDILDEVPQVTSMLVMVQREVAERFTATPGTKSYGAVTVKVEYWAAATIVGSVPASVFVPRPNVESSLVYFQRRTPPDVDRVVLFELVRTAFGQRRKMLRKSLADSVSSEAFAHAGIDATRRPEDLDLTEWCALTTAALATTAVGTP